MRGERTRAGMLPGTRARRAVAAVGSGSRCRALVQAGSCGVVGRGCTRCPGKMRRLRGPSPRGLPEGLRDLAALRGSADPGKPRAGVTGRAPGKHPGTEAFWRALLAPAEGAMRFPQLDRGSFLERSLRGGVASLSRAFHPVSGRRGGKQAGALVRTPADPASWPPPSSRSGFAPSQSLQRPPERSIPRPARSAGRPRSRQRAAADRRTLAWSGAGSGTATGKPDGTPGRGSRDLPPGGPLLKGSHPADGSPDGTPFLAWAACTGPGKRPCVPSCFPSGAGETR